MLKIYLAAGAVLVLLGGTLYHFAFGPIQYSRGYQAGLAEHPTETCTQQHLDAKTVTDLKANWEKEWTKTHKGKVTILKPPATEPTVIYYEDEEVGKSYESLLSSVQEDYEARLNAKEEEIYNLKNAKPGATKTRKFGLGLAFEYIYPKTAMAGPRIEWGKTMVIPLIGRDWDDEKIKYGALIGFRF